MELKCKTMPITNVLYIYTYVCTKAIYISSKLKKVIYITNVIQQLFQQQQAA